MVIFFFFFCSPLRRIFVSLKKKAFFKNHPGTYSLSNPKCPQDETNQICEKLFILSRLFPIRRSDLRLVKILISEILLLIILQRR